MGFNKPSLQEQRVLVILSIDEKLTNFLGYFAAWLSSPQMNAFEAAPLRVIKNMLDTKEVRIVSRIGKDSGEMSFIAGAGEVVALESPICKRNDAVGMGIAPSPK